MFILRKKESDEICVGCKRQSYSSFLGRENPL